MLYCDWSRKKGAEPVLDVIGSVVGVLCCDWLRIKGAEPVRDVIGSVVGVLKCMALY